MKRTFLTRSVCMHFSPRTADIRFSALQSSSMQSTKEALLAFMGYLVKYKSVTPEVCLVSRVYLVVGT